MKRLAAILFVMLLFCGCAASPRAKKIEIADENMIRNCSHLGDVHGRSLWGGYICMSIGVQSAKNEALNMAAMLGATHVVWMDVSGFFFSTAHGRAYRCY